MFGLKKKSPDRAFSHTYDCKIVQSDPGVEIPWSYVGDGLWEAVCVCTKEFYRDPEMDKRARLDPLDPKTSQHAGQCEFAGVTDAAVVRLALGSQTRTATRGLSALPASTAGRSPASQSPAGEDGGPMGPLPSAGWAVGGPGHPPDPSAAWQRERFFPWDSP